MFTSLSTSRHAQPVRGTLEAMSNVTRIETAKPQVLEFFAGIGLARIGLEQAGFHVAWANDFEPAKKAMYDTHFDPSLNHNFVLGDIGQVEAATLPKRTSLAWASSPCTDLSLAGGRAGLSGSQSGTFWHFIRILDELNEQRPAIAVLENVIGLATSNGGDDLTAAIRAFNGLGYSVDVLSIDARRFVPQSRPRLFLVAVQNEPMYDSDEPSELRPDWLQWVFSDESLRTHRAPLPIPPQPMVSGFGRVTEKMHDDDPRWWSRDRSAAFLASLSPIQHERINQMRNETSVSFRTAYRRTRKGVAVWEVRPDDVSGCLRTARGGSSKQAVVRLGNGRFHVRWMTPLEYARLMGANEYNFGNARNNQILSGFGDAVAVPAVSWLAEHYLLPLVHGHLGGAQQVREAARV